MKARTTRLNHSADLGAPDDHRRVAMGVALGLGISMALWMMGAAVVYLLV
jgi:hypothetical protein